MGVTFNREPFTQTGVDRVKPTRVETYTDGTGDGKGLHNVEPTRNVTYTSPEEGAKNDGNGYEPKRVETTYDGLVETEESAKATEKAAKTDDKAKADADETKAKKATANKAKTGPRDTK